MSNLLLTMLDKLGADVDAIGDRTGLLNISTAFCFHDDLADFEHLLITKARSTHEDDFLPLGFKR